MPTPEYLEIAGLDGTEVVDAVGFPYHGRSVVNRLRTLVSSEVEGQPALPATAAIDNAHGLHHYLIRSENLPEGWSYCFLYGIDAFDKFNISYGENPHAVSIYNDKTHLVGAPVRLGDTGAINQFAAYKVLNQDILRLENLSRKTVHDLDIPLGSTGGAKYITYHPNGLDYRILTIDQLENIDESVFPVFKSSILDIHNNKLLISIELTGMAQSFAQFPFDNDNTYLEGRRPEVGYESYNIGRKPRATELGRTIIALFEITIDATAEPSIARIYAPVQMQGAFNRTSPAAPTVNTRAAIGWGFSASVTDWIIDASYSPDGSIITTKVSAEHSGSRKQSYIDTYTVYNSEFSSTITVARGTDVRTDSYKYTFDAYGNRTPSTAQESVLIKNGVELLSLTGRTAFSLHGWRDYDRAPYNGSEMLMLTLGDDVYGASSVEGAGGYQPGTPYTIRVRNNKNHCVTSFTTIEAQQRRTVDGVTRIPFVKIAPPNYVISPFGISEIAGFQDDVPLPIGTDNRYPFTYYEHGYIGALAKQFTNPETGALSAGDTAYPMARINFR